MMMMMICVVLTGDCRCTRRVCQRCKRESDTARLGGRHRQLHETVQGRVSYRATAARRDALAQSTARCTTRVSVNVCAGVSLNTFVQIVATLSTALLLVVEFAVGPRHAPPCHMRSGASPYELSLKPHVLTHSLYLSSISHHHTGATQNQHGSPAERAVFVVVFTCGRCARPAGGVLCAQVQFSFAGAAGRAHAHVWPRHRYARAARACCCECRWRCLCAGIAPFRGFLHELRARRESAATAPPSNIVLYYGCRRIDTDSLYIGTMSFF